MRGGLLLLLVLTLALGTFHPVSAADFDLTVGFQTFNYKENLESPKKSEERGVLSGIGLSKMLLETDVAVLRLAANLTIGQTLYDGAIRDSRSGEITPYQDRTDHVIVDIASLFHAGFVYGGVGYHRWERQLASYIENYSWGYVPLGLRFSFDPNLDCSFAVDVGAEFMFSGTIEIPPGGAFITHGQAPLGNRTGWHIKGDLIYEPSESMSIQISPWYRYFAIGQSEPFSLTTFESKKMTVYEPDSATHQFGVSISVPIR